MVLTYLVCYDESPPSAKALETVSRMARSGENGDFVYVLYVEKQQKKFDAITVTSDLSRSKEREVHARINRYPDAVLGGAGIRHKLLIGRGEERETILSTIGERNVDICALGSTGLTGITKIVLGSVSDYVSKHAHCAVLVCH